MYRKFSWVQFIKYIVNLFKNLSISSFHHSCPYVTNRKQRSLTPYSETKESLYGGHCCGHCFASWFGTMASSRSPNSAVHQTHALELVHSYIQLSQSLAQQFLFQTFRASKFEPVRTHSFLTFLAVQCSNAQIFFFYFTKLIIYIEIWQSRNTLIRYFRIKSTYSKYRRSVWEQTWRHLTVSVWPTIVTRQAIADHWGCMDKSQTLIVRSDEPETSLGPLPPSPPPPSSWMQRTVPECPTSVMTDHGLFVRTSQTLMVLSCEPDTMRVSSICTHVTACVWPSNVRMWQRADNHWNDGKNIRTHWVRRQDYE